MQHKITMATVVVLLALAGITFSRAAAPAGTAAGAGQTKWEYRILPSGQDGTEQCNDLGAQGWELVSVVAHPASSYYYFKRPK